MSKQDMNGVRTAQDLERKYDLGSIGRLKQNYELQKENLTKVENELTNFVNATTKNLEDIQNQVDGNITTWFSSGIPTIENYPANEWSTDDDKNNHLGDLYYNQETGYAYRFSLENEIYSWLKITDNDVTEALALANSAKDTADRKRQVFVVQPKPPYDVGDLWIKDEEIYRCQTSRPNGEIFEDNDWIKATKYTDDTVANQVGNKLTILSGTVTEIRQDVDELNTTMTNTTKLVDEQGNTIGTLQEKQSATSQTVDEISSKVSTIGNQIIPTSQATGSYIHIEDSVSAPLINLEIEGKSEQSGESPSPYYPSEIKNVGYENSFDVTKISENTALLSADGTTATSNYSHISDYIEVKANEIYTLIFNYDSLSNSATRAICYYDKNKSFLSGNYYTPSDKKAKISPTEDGYIRFCYDLNCYDIQLAEGNHSYIPHGKYGIEVEIVGKNLFDKEKLEQNGISTTGEEIENAYIVRTDFIKVLKNADYIVSFDFNGTIGFDVRIFQYDSNKNFIGFDYTNTTNLSIKAKSNAKYLRLSFYTDRQITPATYLNYFSNIQLEQNKTNTKFEEHKSTVTQFVLNEPLRSLPNGVKDRLYIKNNNLYVDRKVGSQVFDGSEAWYSYANYTGEGYCYYIHDAEFAIIPIDSANYQYSYCSHFTNKYAVWGTENARIGKYSDHGTVSRKYFISDKPTVDEFKAWLSENPVQLDYELAEPYTEELGEIEMPSTLKGVTNITTTDELNPNINIEYVRDTTLSSYVEGQLQNERVIREENIAELIIENNQIKESVQTVSGSVDGLKTTVSSATDTLTSQGRLLEIVSTNIDKSTGEVREVTTTTGFTFNAKGMTISDDGGFKGEHTAQGTFYKDGETVTGQYTKDGSKQKDLELFGTYSYGKENIDDTPMFIAQLYKDENGEECFGHFYNGGGY